MRSTPGIAWLRAEGRCRWRRAAQSARVAGGLDGGPSRPASIAASMIKALSAVSAVPHVESAVQVGHVVGWRLRLHFDLGPPRSRSRVFAAGRLDQINDRRQFARTPDSCGESARPDWLQHDPSFG